MEEEPPHARGGQPSMVKPCYTGCLICAKRGVMKYTPNQAKGLLHRIAALRELASRAFDQGDNVMVLVYDGQVKQLVNLLVKNGVREAA